MSAQVDSNAACATGPPSLQIIKASAARWGNAISAVPKTSRRATALPIAQRLVGNAMEGGMATRPCPAMITSDARHTDRCNRNVIIVSLQGHKHRAGALASNIVKFAGGRAARLPTALTSIHFAWT